MRVQSFAALAALLVSHVLPAEEGKPAGLVGHWPLDGDCQDRSGRGNHGRSHGSGGERGTFDGRASFVEIPSSPTLRFGTGDFTLCAWVSPALEMDDVTGDVLSKFD